MHLYLPCSAFKFEDARSIAENVATEIHSMVPTVTTLNVSTNGRGNNVYIDPNQNDYADTVAAPYSVRPNKNPTVSTPLDWREVRDSLTPEKFTIHTIQKRLEKKGDLFESVTDPKIAQANDKLLIQFL
jgi:bifunctional non-homologous end joining protein LigD